MFLGIDGGGTKTSFALIDDAGSILAMHEEGSAYYFEVGLEGVAAMLRKGAAATLAAACVSDKALQYTFLGLPAYGEDSALKEAFDALPASFLQHGRYQCGNDMICSWAGSLACQDGISIIAGTGSMAYGEYQGNTARAGGWGELFSDEGSAYWIAREGLRLFSRMSDGRAPKGLLHTLLRQHFSLIDDLDICAAVYGGISNERSKLAQLATIVSQAAIGGDQQARAIFIAAADELAQIIEAVRNNLQVPATVVLPVSYSGGVFKSHNLVLEPFTQALADLTGQYALAPPILPPVIGAAMYAAKCCKTELNVDALDNLFSEVERIAIVEPQA